MAVKAPCRMSKALPPYRDAGSPTDIATVKSELAINRLDSAGARDMMLQQRAEERGETEPMAHSYRSNELSLVSGHRRGRQLIARRYR